MRIAFICETPFQLLTAINYANTLLQKNDVPPDVFIRRQLPNSEHIVSRLIPLCVFRKVYLYSYLNEWHHYGIKNRLCILTAPRLYIKKIVSAFEETDYDVIFASTLTNMAMGMIYAYPKAKLYFFDDGIGSYFGRIGIESIPLKWKLIHVLFLKSYLRMTPKRMYVYNTKICKTEWTKNICQLTAISKSNKVFWEMVKDVFEYHYSDLYDICKNVFLSQPFGGKMPLRNKVLDLMMKSDVIIRPHPIETLNLTSYERVDRNANLWELVCAGQISEEHLLISEYSTALVTPKLLFDIEPQIIFLYPLYKEYYPLGYVENLDQIVKMIQELYSHKERVMKVSNLEELKMILHSRNAESTYGPKFH